MQSCIFCKIINREVPAKIIQESVLSIVIEDIHPKAPIHYLIMPKKHIANMLDVNWLSGDVYGDLLELARDLAKELPEPQDFNLVLNNGVSAGQSVFHLHFHFLAGKNIYEGGLKL